MNRKREWVFRLMLELQAHQPGTCFFVTLTYSPEHYPADGNLSKRDLRSFMQSLDYFNGAHVRYFACGEYGGKTGRAHYHAILFGVLDQSAIHQAWGKGMVHVGTVTETSCGYVCGYIMKGMTNESHLDLDGRVPEFSTMSRKPGIGARGADQLGESIVSRLGANPTGLVDVPGVVRSGGFTQPVGRYVKARMRRAVGLPSGTTTEQKYVAAGKFQAKVEAAGGISEYEKVMENNRKVSSAQVLQKYRLAQSRKKL